MNINAMSTKVIQLYSPVSEMLTYIYCLFSVIWRNKANCNNDSNKRSKNYIWHL